MKVYGVFTTYGSTLAPQQAHDLIMYWEDQNYSCIVDAAIELIRDERLYNLGNLGLVVCGDHYRIKIGHYEGVEVKGRKDKVPPEILAQAKRVSLAWPYL